MEIAKIPHTKCVVLEARTTIGLACYLRLYPFSLSPANRFQVIVVKRETGEITSMEFWASLEMAQKSWLQTASAIEA